MVSSVCAAHKEVIHYTSAVGLQGIITSKALWATHFSFLNDHEEVVGFFDRVLPGILEPVFEEYVARADDLRTNVRDAFRLGVDLRGEWLRDFIEKCKEAEVQSSDHYVFSFCGARDAWISRNGLLSQWRGYGHDGGYAIVFDCDGLQELLEKESKLYHEEGLSWGDVQYWLSGVDRTNDRQVENRIECIKRETLDYLRARVIEKFFPAFESITVLSVFCKHRGFEEEQEVRVVVTEPSIEVGRVPEKVDQKQYRKAHTYFRNGVAVPCIHLFEDQKLEGLPIRRIIVGPHPNKIERKKAVEVLLHQENIDAEVVVSDIPFRGM